MSERRYSFDAELRIWRTPSHDSIDYSDGDEVEGKLLDTLQHCRDLGSTSEELRRHIVDWTSEYHLSPQRHALLLPFAIPPSSRVLELGCGCGAITRHLGETGAAVVAVEGSQRRATIAAARCRDLPNVRIHCDNLADFATTERYDLVTLIGVLEYAPAFIHHSDPVGECLRRARSFLADGGRLLVAIENQLGLKYFAGCSEDHAGVPYVGIEGLYAPRRAVTFGRRTLADLLARAGLEQTEWHFPFPDYKMPRIVVTEEGIAAADFDVATLLARTASRDYGGSPLRSFDEAIARRAVWENGLLGELANSFLVFAGTSKVPVHEDVVLARAFNLGRRPHLCAMTTFSRGEAGDIEVTRAAIHPDPQPPGPQQAFIHQHPDERYFGGRLMTEDLHRLARAGWSIESLTAWAQPWIEELGRRARIDDPTLLPPDLVDFTPFNALRADDGTIVYIDAEWRADRDIPLCWVLIRGLAYAFDDLVQPAGVHTDRRTLIEEIARSSGIRIGVAEFELARQWEARLQEHCCGSDDGGNGLQALLGRGPGSQLAVLDVLGNVRGELEKTYSSRSWRLTEPLRQGLDLLQRVRKTGEGEGR
jgi:SAM-dependent methyltransferase